MFGQMEGFLLVSGAQTKCMVMVNFDGRITEDTQETMSMIKNKVMVYLNGVLSFL